MRTNIKRIILNTLAAVAIATACPMQTAAQEYVPTPVTISKEKVKVNGKVCYSHVVQEKQTLYSISKAYGVSIADIYKFNPSLQETGLKKNAILLIPVNDGADAKTAPAEERTPAQPQKPQDKTEPATEKADTAVTVQSDQDKPKAKKKKVHTVKWYEDLDTIAEKYGVSIESIMKVNNLSGRKLTARQKLEIPSPEEAAAIDAALPEAGEVSTLTPAIEQTPEETEDEDKTEPKLLFRKSRTDVALVLPLKADGQSGSRNNMDFYSGVLIAVRDMACEGMDINLDVYDCADGTLPGMEQIHGCDLVIGPVSGNDLGRMMTIAGDTCPVVSPLDPRAESLAGNYGNLIQAPTPHHVLFKDLAEWIKEDRQPEDRIIFITEKGSRENGTASQMKSAVDSAGLAYKTFSYSILEGRNILNPLSSLMTDHGTNRFVVASESEAFVNDVVRNLNLLIHNKYDVVLYAPSKIRNYETMEVENLHNTNLHICLGYNIDYDKAQVRNFLMEYRALFNAEPSQYAFQGYDTARFFIGLCWKYGNRWRDLLDMNDKDMLQSSFEFRRVNGGGWVNTGVKRVVYGKNWSVIQY